MSELLPCPFCGGEANVIDHHNDDGSVSVGCNNDTCLGFSGLGWLYKTEAEAIAAWNSRAELGSKPPYDELLRCLENDYRLLQADFDITRERWMMRGAYIAKQRERIEALEELARDLHADLMEYGCTPNAHRANYKPRFEELGIEVDG